MRKITLTTACAVLALTLTAVATDAPKRQVVTFTELTFDSGDTWNGADESGGFKSRNAHFNNAHNVAWGSWAGFAYSRVTNTDTMDYENQYAVWTPGTGVGGTGSYAVVYDDGAWGNSDVVTLPGASAVHGLFVNNTTYAALSMRDGDAFAKKFGGATGDDEDWFKLTITGKDAAGSVAGSVEVFLADYRFADNAHDYIVGDWTWVDLSTLGKAVETLHFALSSSDNGMWGMNTPAYFAMDNLEFTPQPSLPTASFDALAFATGDYWNGSDGSGGFTNAGAVFANSYNTGWGSWAGFAYSRVNNTNTMDYGNQYAVWTPGSGVGGTGSYAVVYDDGAWGNSDVVTLPGASTVHGLFVNNTTYAALSMRDGDAFAKKFGGATGDDADWFKLTITGKDKAGADVGAVEVYLADYRFSDNDQDYIVGDWTWVDLSALGVAVKTLHFALSSSDNGMWGMNTPAYFAIDNLQFIATPRLALADLNTLPLASGDIWNGSDGSGGFTNAGAVFANSYNPAWGSWAGFSYSRVRDTNTAEYGNQHAVWAPGTGVGATGNYAVVYDDGPWGNADVVTLPAASTVRGFYVNNTTYAALSLLSGDAFAKKFGGATGNDPDWFRLTITGKNGSGVVLGSHDVYLADFQFTDNGHDYVLGGWTWVDLTTFGTAVKTLHFALSSSDMGAWGMNTPAYFALDNLLFAMPPQGTVILLR